MLMGLDLRLRRLGLDDVASMTFVSLVLGFVILAGSIVAITLGTLGLQNNAIEAQNALDWTSVSLGILAALLTLRICTMKGWNYLLKPLHWLLWLLIVTLIVPPALHVSSQTSQGLFLWEIIVPASILLGGLVWMGYHFVKK